ncbi:MAG TPA: ATP-binding protein [Phycisphaerales bacterium]|nr:ATP-binding protein [Phycisphaerales bacterium]
MSTSEQTGQEQAKSTVMGGGGGARWMQGARTTSVLLSATLLCALLGIWWSWWWLGVVVLQAGAILNERRRMASLEARDEAEGDAAHAASGLAGALPQEFNESVARRDGASTTGDIIRAATDRVRSLTTQRNTLRAVLDAAGDPILITNPGGTVVVWNIATQTFLGRSADRVAGRTLEELFTSADIVAVHASAAAGLRRHATVRLAREGGHRLFEVIAAPMDWIMIEGDQTTSSSASRAVCVFLRDITELASASQLQTDFVANASHELRTPLSSIRGATETLLDDSEDPALRRRLLQMVETNVSRLEELIRDLLDLSRLESKDTGPSLGPVSLGGLIETLTREFQQACTSKRVSLSFEIDPGIRTLHTDGRLLDMILRNLIENAVKFAYEGTTVHVTGRVIERAGERGQGVRFQVIDQGIGIPLAGQSRVFERFYQVDPSRQGGTHRRGTGLGLAIVKSAVEALKGTVSVESVWKQGTVMTVDLPGSPEP